MPLSSSPVLPLVGPAAIYRQLGFDAFVTNCFDSKIKALGRQLIFR
jgi:hypothetical protein